MNIKFKNNTLLLAIITGIVMIISTNQSFADPSDRDVKSFPATMCQTAASGTGYVWYRHSEGQLTNYHASEGLIAICPLVRDNMASTAGLISLVISYVDAHPTQDVQCSLHYYNHVKRTFQRITLKKWSNRTYLLSLDSKDRKTVGKELTSYSVSCFLPPKYAGKTSRLTSISYQEEK